MVEVSAATTIVQTYAQPSVKTSTVTVYKDIIYVVLVDGKYVEY